MSNLNNYLDDGASSIARSVLCLLQGNLCYDMLDISKTSELDVARFDNCREQGYTVSVRNKNRKQINISFAEHRSSDSLIIYKWFKNTFNSPTLSDMDDTSWNNAVYFKYDGIYAAMEYIKQELMEHCKQGEINE